MPGKERTLALQGQEGGPDGLAEGELSAPPSGFITAVSRVVLETNNMVCNKKRESVHAGELASRIGPDGVVAVV